MRARHVAIVGAGPTCLYSLAHLAALLPRTRLPHGLRVSVFERSGRFGSGEVHDDRQVRTSYMNRVAAQVAFAPEPPCDELSAFLPEELRPTLYEWSALEFARTGDPDFDLLPTDVPRRHVHGSALRDMFDRYTELIRSVPGVTVDLHREEVTDVRDHGRRLVLTTGGPEPRSLQADHVLFATGHAWNDPSLCPRTSRTAALAEGNGAHYVPVPYPLEHRVTERTVPPGSVVALRGLGLTALDVILHLTEGRGGTFVPDAGAGEHGLRYRPGGREPQLIIGTSPSGVPVSGRPLNEKVDDPSTEHSGVFLTLGAVDRMRTARGRRALDFRLDVLPLVVLEMAYVFYRTVHGDLFAQRFPAVVKGVYEEHLDGRGPRGEEGTERLLAPVADLLREWDPHGTTTPRFDWRSLLDPLPKDSASPRDDWHARVVAFLRSDLSRSLRGNLHDPVKAACDGVWRDLRSVLSHVADGDGLEARSRREFDQVHMRYYHRWSNGAGLEPMCKLLALVEHGLLDFSLGPDPVLEAVPERRGMRVRGGLTGRTRNVSSVVEARVHRFDPWRDRSPLYRNLLRRGLVRQWVLPEDGPDRGYRPGGLDLDEGFHPLRPDGTSDDRLTFLGTPAEGRRTFQESAARPGPGNEILLRSARWAEEVIGACLTTGTTAKAGHR